MSIDPRQLSQDLDRGKFSPLYFFSGEETFIIDEAIDKLKAKVLSEGLTDFNLNIFYAGDANVDSICDAVETFPMMAPRRLVIVKQAEDFSAKELDRLSALIEKPVDTTIFVCIATKVDMRKKFFKSFESKGVLVKFQRPFDNQLNPWIHYIASKFDKQIAADAVELVKEWVGTALVDIKNELAKVAQYVGNDVKILTIEHVRAVVGRTRVDTVFELVNSMGVGDCANSFQQLANLLDNGQSEVGVLAMIIRHFRILLLCQEGLKEGLSQPQIASRVGVHGFYVKEYIEQARRQEQKQLLEVYDVLLDTDRALKSNPLSSHLWLENLVLQSCRPRNDSARP
jgi:DNA polymerase-3 subunit delta